MSAKYILCRPQGGLNDMLCQIERCCRYADAHGRVVVVDTSYWAAASFHDDLSRYFEARHSNIVLNVADVPGLLDERDVYPSCLSGQLNAYETRPKIPFQPYADFKTGIPLTFDFSQVYRERLLVHHQEGGGDWSQVALARLVLTDMPRADIQRALQSIGGPYDAVHVRHTDYRSDYQPLIDGLRGSGLDRLYVASDNQAVVADFQSQLPNKAIFNFAGGLSEDGAPLHLQRLDAARTTARNMDCLRDLMLLCLSQTFLFGTVRGFGGKAYPSGFSTLARNLRQSPAIIRGLMDPAYRLELRLAGRPTGSPKASD